MPRGQGVRCCVSRFRRRACRSERDREAELAWPRDLPHCGDLDRDFSGGLVGSTPRAPHTAAEPMQLPRLVFLPRPEPGGGGGGGGNRQRQPPSRAKAIGQDRLTVPVTKRLEVRSSPQDNAPLPSQVLLEATPLVSGTAVMTGLPEASQSLPLSYGTGSGGGVGGGSGSGIGPGRGPGMAEGLGGGSVAALIAAEGSRRPRF